MKGSAGSCCLHCCFLSICLLCACCLAFWTFFESIFSLFVSATEDLALWWSLCMLCSLPCRWAMDAFFLLRVWLILFGQYIVSLLCNTGFTLLSLLFSTLRVLFSCCRSWMVLLAFPRSFRSPSKLSLFTSAANISKRGILGSGPEHPSSASGLWRLHFLLSWNGKLRKAASSSASRLLLDSFTVFFFTAKTKEPHDYNHYYCPDTHDWWSFTITCS